MGWTLAAHDNHNTVPAAFKEARVQEVDGRTGWSMIRDLLSTYPHSEMAKDVAAAILYVGFVVMVALLLIRVEGYWRGKFLPGW